MCELIYQCRHIQSTQKLRVTVQLITHSVTWCYIIIIWCPFLWTKIFPFS